MARVKCGGCGERIEKDTAVRYGIQNFCPDGDCRRPKPRKPTTKPAKSPKRKVNIDPELRRKVFERDGNVCRFCGSSQSLNAHHVIYLSQQGPNSEDNLLTLCSGFANGCHERVHSNKRRFQPVLLFVLEQHYEEHIFLTVPQAIEILKLDSQDPTQSEHS